MIKGLATVIYPAPDLEQAKAWYATAFKQQPYFDQPYYVGFNIGGYELGLDPNQTISEPGAAGGVAYWRVADLTQAMDHFLASGARQIAPPQDVGDGIKVATIADPFGSVIGLIENPHFTLPIS